jgi:hypothetical protein
MFARGISALHEQLKPCSPSASARDRAYGRSSGGFSRSGRMRANPRKSRPRHLPGPAFRR